MTYPSLLRALPLAALLLIPLDPAQAAVYRCKDASGATTYSQTPCKTGQTSQSMNHVQRTADPAMTSACSAAQRFAEVVYEKIQTGAAPDAVIDEYGGVNYINSATLNIINYIGTFRHQTETPVYQVSKLARSKCHNGGFGRFAASDLPLQEDPMPPGLAAPEPRPTDATAQPAVPAAPAGQPDAATIQQLEQYLEQLKAQQQP